MWAWKFCSSHTLVIPIYTYTNTLILILSNKMASPILMSLLRLTRTPIYTHDSSKTPLPWGHHPHLSRPVIRHWAIMVYKTNATTPQSPAYLSLITGVPKFSRKWESIRNCFSGVFFFISKLPATLLDTYVGV